MRRKVMWWTLLGATMLICASFAQTNADKLRDAGSISFDLNDFDYYLRADVFDGRGCVNDLASGEGTNQPDRVYTFAPGTLNFTVRIRDVLQEVDSDALVTFIGTALDGNTVQWTFDQTFDPPVCAIISAQGNTLPFRFYRVFGTLTASIEEVSCQDDPLGLLGRRVNLRLTPAANQPNEVGFVGRVTDGVCSVEYFGGCGLAYNLSYVGYGGACPAGPEGDVNGDGCVDDADLLAVLFAFGSSGSGLAEDVNGDGVVDDADLLTVLFNFGAGC